MTKRSRIILTVAASLAGPVIVILIAALITVQTAWFQNYLRTKIVSATEEGTGGKVEIGSFSFSLRHLQVAIKNFVLHGTEPAGSQPLLRIDSLDLELVLFSSGETIDLQHLGVTKPVANIVIFPDGKTNLPTPRTTSKSNTSGLQTIVDLAVKHFDLTQGSIHFLRESVPLNVQGDNLNVTLRYDATKPAYEGSVRLDPILAQAAKGSPLTVHLDLPVVIEKDAVGVENARLFTAASNIQLSARLDHMANPEFSGTAKAHVSISEIQRAVGTPQNTIADPNAAANLEVVISGARDRIDIQSARLAIGQSRLQAAGLLQDPAGKGSMHFQANLFLAELGRLAKLTAKPDGTVRLAGDAQLLSGGRYLAAGTLEGRNLSEKNGAETLGPLFLNSRFHVDPDLVELSGLQLLAFGGEVRGTAGLKESRQLSVNARLSGFDIQKLMHDLGYKPLGYSGSISGDLAAGGDVKAKGVSGIAAQLRLNIAGGNSGVPVEGRIAAAFDGKTEQVSLDPSHVSLPHTRLDMTGVLGSHLTLNLTSSNLQDFLPALKAASPQTTGMPAALQGGNLRIAASVDGALRSPTIDTNVSVTKFVAQNREFDRLSAALRATPSGVQVANGVLQKNTLAAQFAGSVGLHRWNTSPQSPVGVDATIHNARIEDLLALAGEAQLPVSGTLNGSAKIGGALSNPSGGAEIAIADASAYGQPIESAQAKIAFSNQLVTLQPLDVTAGPAHLSASGTYKHAPDNFSTGAIQLNVSTNSIALSQLKALQTRRPGFSGNAQLTASVAAVVQPASASQRIVPQTINANLTATGLKDKAESYGDLSLSASTAGNTVRFGFDSNVAGSSTTVHGTTELIAGYPSTVDASIRSLDVRKALLLVGEETVPASGKLDAQVHAQGPVANPQGNLSVNLTNAVLYGEPINNAAAKLTYASNEAQIPQFTADLPAGSIRLNGSYRHPAGNFTQGTLSLHVDSDPMQVSKIHSVEQARPGLQATLHVFADVNGGLNLHATPQVSLTQLNANLRADSVGLNGKDFGDLNLQATSSGQQIAITLDSNLAKSSIQGRGHVSLTDGYPVDAAVNFSNVSYANLQPLLSATGSAPSSAGLDGVVAGTLSVKGPITKTDQLTAHLSLRQAELSTTAIRDSQNSGRPVMLLQNQGPIDIAFDHSVVNIMSAHLAGRTTDMAATGKIDFAQSEPLNLKLSAKTDLALLQQLSHQIYSSGNIAANVSIGGTLSQPVANGQIELHNASVNLTESPNGISNANGVIALNGTTATIRNLTAESGGGKITVNGFAGLTGTTVRYVLRATGNSVRTRYAGVTVVSNSALTLNGTLQRSLLSGTVTITRIALGSQSDTGSILSLSATPPETPGAPSGPLQGMRLDIHVITSSGLAVQSSMSQNLSANADLSLRGTLLEPGAVGQVVITQGNLVFFGNQYSVNRGVINFYNPTKIEPILDIALQTSVQGVNVTLGVTGPIDNMKLNYRSDPPLRFDEIVALLAAGKTPTSDPNIAASQPQTPDQTFTQMGESALVSQAVAAPIASRLQRVFGVNQIKIDPAFTSGSVLGQSRVTLQQQISPTIVFTYTTDLTDTTAQIIKVEWAFTPRFSAVATRDEFGILSLDFFYKKHAK